jgi:hypothetical protein
MVVSPTPIAVTRPSLTAATFALPVIHITFLLSAFEGDTVADMNSVSPSVSSSPDGLTITPVTLMGSGSGTQAVINWIIDALTANK